MITDSYLSFSVGLITYNFRHLVIWQFSEPDLAHGLPVDNHYCRERDTPLRV